MKSRVCFSRKPQGRKRVPFPLAEFRAAMVVVALAVSLGLGPGLSRAQPAWEGTDKTVVAKFAEQAGRPPRAPLLNTDRGDLLLFLFLLAGAVGGFIAGYTFRGLFPPGRATDERHASTP